MQHLFETVLALSVAILATGLGVEGDVPAPVNCALPINSPQFATLCQVAEAIVYTDPLTLVSYTANAVCDADCRCTHGAFARGGRCNNVSSTRIFCQCDYDLSPTREPLAGPEGCGLFPLVTNLCQTPLSPFFNNACNSDCQCSHGYGNTGNHPCVVDNSYNNNNVSYCYCGGHTNIL